jgi:hypothetical protein
VGAGGEGRSQTTIFGSVAAGQRTDAHLKETPWNAKQSFKNIRNDVEFMQSYRERNLVKDNVEILIIDLVDNLYLSWPLSTTTGKGKVDHDKVHHSDAKTNRLLPLGLALVELSLAKSVRTLLSPEDEGEDVLVTRLETASRLVKMVYMESGTNYVEAVNSCLCWSGLCLEIKFEERVFDTIISPLLKDLINFEGLA